MEKNRKVKHCFNGLERDLFQKLALVLHTSNDYLKESWFVFMQSVCSSSVTAS